MPGRSSVADEQGISGHSQDIQCLARNRAIESIAMSLLRTLIGGIIAAGLTASPAWADRPRDQDRAFEATRHGRSMPLPQIERKVMPFMGGADYLGPEFLGDTYRLKFMRDGRVIWIDVDAATGRIIGKSGR
jgi:hypothetical protein